MAFRFWGSIRPFTFALIPFGVAVLLGLAVEAGAMGKPPKDDPPPTSINPIFVFEIVDAVDQIGVVDAEGNLAVVLASTEIQAFSATWMPNGQDIVFDGVVDGVEGLFRLGILDDLGGLVINGTPELILETFGAISPDVVETAGGTHLLTFAANAILDPAAPADIFLARLNDDGTLMLDGATNPIVLNVTDSDVSSEFGQALSPSGDRLAYIADEQAIKIVEVFIDDLNGSLTTGSPVTLVEPGDGTPLGNASSIGGLDYSNVNEKLVIFATVPGSDRDLWIVPVDDPLSAESLAVTPDSIEVFPSWSPDDSQIVYHRLGTDVCSNKRKGPDIQGLAIRYADGTLFENCEEMKILSSKQNPYRHPEWRPN